MTYSALETEIEQQTVLNFYYCAKLFGCLNWYDDAVLANKRTTSTSGIVPVSCSFFVHPSSIRASAVPRAVYSVQSEWLHEYRPDHMRT